LVSANNTIYYNCRFIIIALNTVNDCLDRKAIIRHRYAGQLSDRICVLTSIKCILVGNQSEQFNSKAVLAEMSCATPLYNSKVMTAKKICQVGFLLTKFLYNLYTKYSGDKNAPWHHNNCIRFVHKWKGMLLCLLLFLCMTQWRRS